MANPERSTELLWGAGARGGLSLERIVRAAVELADAEGLAAVSMRRVAEGLGFTTMALYRHVPGKGELVDLMRDHVMASAPSTPGSEAAVRTARDTEAALPGAEAPLPGSEAALPTTRDSGTPSGKSGGQGVGPAVLSEGRRRQEVASVPQGEGHGQGVASVSSGESRGRGGWREGLEGWARANMALYRRHPWLIESADGRRVPGPNAIAGFEQALAIVDTTGLPPAETVAVVTLVGGFVESAARQVLEAARAERDSGVSHEEWWGARDSLFDHFGERYPTLSRIYEAGGYDRPLDPFEFGLQRVLDGIQTLMRDETRDETQCAMCGKPVGTTATGRPRAYCSQACRQRAYRRRTT